MRIGNWPLAERTVRRIIADPDSWNQRWWAKFLPECGTVYCFAGHAIVESGLEFNRTENGTVDETVRVPVGCSIYIPGSEIEQGSYLAAPSAVACDLLGMNFLDGDLLFDSDNRFFDILKLLGDWAKEDGFDWPADLTLTPEQRRIVKTFHVDSFDSDEAWEAGEALEIQLLHPGTESSL